MRYILVLLDFAAVMHDRRLDAPALPEGMAAKPPSEPQTALFNRPRRRVPLPRARWPGSRRRGRTKVRKATPRLLDDAPTAQARSRAFLDAEAIDKPGEQHTSTRAAPEPEQDRGDIERNIQNELTRLACLTGKPGKSWEEEPDGPAPFYAARQGEGQGPTRRGAAADAARLSRQLLQALQTGRVLRHRSNRFAAGQG